MAMSLDDADGGTQYFGTNAKYVTRPEDGKRLRVHHTTATFLHDKYGWPIEDAPDLGLDPEFVDNIQSGVTEIKTAAIAPGLEGVKKGDLIGYTDEAASLVAQGGWSIPDEKAPLFDFPRIQRGGIKYPDPATAKLYDTLRRAKNQRKHHKQMAKLHKEGIKNIDQMIANLEAEIRKAEDK